MGINEGRPEKARGGARPSVPRPELFLSSFALISEWQFPWAMKEMQEPG